MRIQYKGGIWKNTEDEILKAAVMKYGKNQWPRIASLLVRKSAKQCKARWFEWLDPSIKKTEWTREEEEKLLHLAKIMPTAWRTIAPMIGRTAAQCIEHYEHLIDNARQKAAADKDGIEISVPAAPLSRPSDAEVPPESKPARPDPVDMDEDELEMLTEARARLSNTKGKKAKRKAREKQLNDAKRLAQLQKIRELKAAGIPIKKSRRNKNALDYATEIPFLREPSAGFYDTLEEDKQAEKLKNKKDQIGKLLQKYKEKGFEQIEEENRRKDNEKRKRVLAENPLASLGLNRTRAFQDPPLKKARFALPDPVLKDSELKKLAKTGRKPGLRVNKTTARGAANFGTTQNARTSDENFSMTNASGVSASSWSQERDRRVQTLMDVQSSQTPLYGGETPVPELELNGRVTPTPSTFRTPNLLASPFAGSVSSVADANPSDAKKRKETLKELGELVRKGLMALPPPENEYVLDLSSASYDGETDVSPSDNDDDMVEDAEEELVRREEQEKKEVPLLQERLLSSVARRNLPIGNVKTRNIDPGSVGFLIQRDHEVTRIVADFQKGERKAYETLNELRSLISTDGSDDRGRLRKADEMMNMLIKEDGNFGTELMGAIEEDLRKSFERKLATAITERSIPRFILNDEDKFVEKVFSEEMQRRKRLIENEVKNGRGWIEPFKRDFDIESLWRCVEKDSSKRVCANVRSAVEEGADMEVLVDTLWQKVGGRMRKDAMRIMIN